MRKAAASLILLMALLAVVLIISHGYARPAYDLAVKTGDWVEYEIVNSYGMFTYLLKTGDRLKMVITGFDYDSVYDPEGNMAFIVQIAIYDLYVNGQLNQTGLRDTFYYFQHFFYPIDEAFWQDYAELLQAYKEHYYEENGEFEWSIQDKDGYKEIYISGSRYGYGYVVRITVDMTAGVSVQWEWEWTYQDQTAIIEAKLSSTNISGVSLPGKEGLDWWLFALIGGVVACVVVGAVVGTVVIMRRRAPPPTYPLPPGRPPAPAASTQYYPRTSTQAAPPAPAGYITCPYCGALNLPTAKFCQACGRALKPATGEG